MRYFLCVLASLGAVVVSNGELPRPRGVAISKASLYKPGVDFTCLDGSAVLPYDRINDDYCDCFDGSDEPGTSACPNGMYHCTNAGHKPRNIPSSWVNDGICDCCDGSDEYESDKKCENYCKELGKKAREEEEQRQQLLQQGHQIYQQYITTGKNAREGKQKRLTELESQKQAAETLRYEKQEAKELAEEPEKAAKELHQKAWEEEKERKRLEQEKVASTEAFQEMDDNIDNVVSVEEVQAHQEFDIDGNGEVSPEEAKEYLEDNDQVDQAMFSEVVWPNIKQIYQKPTPPDAEQDPETEQESVTPTPTPDSIPDPPSYGDEEDEDDDEDMFHEENYDDEDDYDDEEEEPPENNDSQQNEEMPPYNEETQKLIEVANAARNEYDEADRDFNNIENEIKDINKYLELDLGPDHAFYPLKGQCYEFEDREYVYKLCPFDRASQRSKSGGAETSLGNWGHWSGDGNNKYSSFKMEKGQSCWNGPARSVDVKLHCGTENTLTAASEPNRCEYEYHFTTPAACSEQPQPPVQDHEHQEL